MVVVQFKCLSDCATLMDEFTACYSLCCKHRSTCRHLPHCPQIILRPSSIHTVCLPPGSCWLTVLCSCSRCWHCCWLGLGDGLCSLAAACLFLCNVLVRLQAGLKQCCPILTTLRDHRCLSVGSADAYAILNGAYCTVQQQQHRWFGSCYSLQDGCEKQYMRWLPLQAAGMHVQLSSECTGPI